MGLFQRIQTWIADHLGRSDDGSAVADTESPEAADSEPRLDPTATTKARSGSTDEAVDKLNAVRQAAEDDETAASGEADEQTDGPTEDSDDRDSS